MDFDFTSDINKNYQEAMNYKSIDRLMVQVGWAHLAAIIVLAVLASVIKIADYYPSPLAWRVISQPEAIGAILIALVATLALALLRGRLENHYAWRIFVILILNIYSYLLVFLSGGSIEMHFHFFIVLIAISLYYDWRLAWVSLVSVALHHGILNYVAPTWVYFYGRNDVAVVAHAIPVLVAVILITILCQNNRAAVVSLMLTQKQKGTEEFLRKTKG